MHSHNDFVININQQKSLAKKRLKAIRSGDRSTLALIKHLHPNADDITPETIQLADVQCALARELGLPSWAKLKAHVDNLAQHQKAIDQQHAALDSDAATLHVRCGHDLQHKLKNCGFEGEFLPMIDPLCIGPIPSDDKMFIAARAQYVTETLLPIMGRTDSVQGVALHEQRSIERLLDDKHERIVFWVEHDAYDQLMLLRALTLLAHKTDAIIELIEISQFPGTERFIGFGQLPEAAIRSCWQNRRPVNAKLMSQAEQCWQALRSPNPNTLFDLIEQHTLDALPNIAKVLRRYLQELPNTNTGLSMTQQLAISVLANTERALTVDELFTEYQKIEPLPCLGDVMFYALLLPLAQLESPLLTLSKDEESWQKQTVRVTARGKLCLEGEQILRQSYWVGSHYHDDNERWVWDHNQRSTLKKQRNKAEFQRR
ncbi:DUF1835 domain-containing protein [uncultured Vibrio sp.]|uniref:DUF1835 domain-containing protein n=1 Tax=uncultured Vibrio sp. TaxID=114054 RepID=UPI000910855C|nr:DUF1835 domain-containing protein [uncultured Vibrio sp.]OIQ26538.1 MAG: hypothetical protein BM561_01945 [Vibrio sp. MedPE-SWchi]